MPETMNVLETALENEAKLFLRLINELQNDDLYEFIHKVALLHPDAGRGAANEVLQVAHNVKRIDDALENLYVV